MLEYKPNMVLSTQDYNVVGTRPIRHDGYDKVTGRARYGADIHMAGLLQGEILRSPHAHARIKSIDTSRALALPGVEAVLTSADMPQHSDKVADMGEGVNGNLRFFSNNCLAGEKVLYKGQAVAAVAAINPHIAEEALALINVEYEVLLPVLTAEEAMRDDAPLLHERLMTLSVPASESGGMLSDDDKGKGSNISNHFEFSAGDIDKGFQEADVVVEREYHTAPVHQGYIEPHSATALWSSDGKLTLWCSSQGQFAMRDQTAMLLDIPLSNIKVVPMEIGGGFGGKTKVYLEPVVALLSRKTGRPVKITMSRTEVFEGTGPTAGTHYWVKMGATKEGRLIAAQARLVFEAGAYPPSNVSSGAQTIFACYDIPNVYVEAFDVVVNKQMNAAYRAPGSPTAAFAEQTVLDEICEKLQIDPIELSLLNAAKEGTRRATGPVFPRIGYIETLQAAKEHAHYLTPLKGPNQGRGVASGFWFNSTGPSSAVASVNPDGTVSLVEGSPDIGGSRVVVAQQLAEVLGIHVEDVKPSVGDTDSIGFTSLTGGSAVAFKTGWACYEAAQDIKGQMIQRAARIWGVPVEDVEYKDSSLQHKSDPELRITFKAMANRLNNTGGPIVGRATVEPRGVGVAFAIHIADVEVDPETGKVDILRYTAIQDVGKAIHPSYVEGQIQGGAVQGIGFALNEEYFFNDQGHMMNSSFLDYRMPISLDLPMIDTVIVEVPNPGHPYGARGVAELPIVPPMGAIANAIYNAVGVRMNQLPMSPGRVLEAIWEKESNGRSTGG